MKKLLFTTALCLVFGFSFAQKKAVNEAKNEIRNENPNFAEARTNIQAALKNPETKDLAETWYIAGFIETKQFNGESVKELIQNNPSKPNYPTMYTALWNATTYYLKCDSLEQIPDAKGKIKSRYRKDIKTMFLEKRAYFINGGGYYYDQKDYPKAYNFFDTYISMPEWNMFQGDKDAANRFVKDTTYYQIQYYTAVLASQLGNSQKAIDEYEALKDKNYNTDNVYKFLCYEYEQIKDTTNLMRVLREGVAKFPTDSYYLFRLINQYLVSSSYNEAIAYMGKAIAKESNNAQFYNVLGVVYENKKDFENAKKAFLKSIELDSDYVDPIGNYGRIVFNDALEDQTKANDIKDNTEYKKAIEKVKEKFRIALPYFEKAHKMKPEERDYLKGLHAIYYNLNMGPEFDKTEAELNALNGSTPN